uniref:Protein kinase domain-containing protein n=1 Tax=Oryza meridionalis TaxID=40149 RepID=A0A0E0E7X4_9ORYZ
MATISALRRLQVAAFAVLLVCLAKKKYGPWATHPPRIRPSTAALPTATRRRRTASSRSAAPTSATSSMAPATTSAAACPRAAGHRRRRRWDAVPRLPGRCTGERCCLSIIPPTLNFYVPRMFNFANGKAAVDDELRGGRCLAEDINECLHPKEYGCYGNCMNTPGGYTCVCPPGTSENPTEMNGCRSKDKFTFVLKVVTAYRKLIRMKQKFFEQNGGVILQQQMHSGGGARGFRIFSMEELKKVTNIFAAGHVLGRGGHGVVYKGVLKDKTVVAIKKSKMMEEAQTKEFARETTPKADIPLDIRLQIAAESAEALSYIHSSASPPTLHGDVKMANILLDDKLSAKVFDFGASKLAPTDEIEIATWVQGTCEYLDPEYLMTCQLTDKSDVYSFGVIVLELLTRKKALYLDGPEEDRSLVSCFTTAVKVGRHQELLDIQVGNEMSDEMLQEITHLLMRCISMNGEERPMMKEVAEMLEMLRRYQHHPWAGAEGNVEEVQSFLSRGQQSENYQLGQQDVLDLEEGSKYTFSF